MAQQDSNFNFGKTWELSPYELHRQPQEVITDNTEIAVSPRSLNSELMCPICLDMLKFTMTTKECLHRFCQECIITALRSGNKECPTCRKKLISKRSLRHDPNFDMIIQKIYPIREEYDAMQERVIHSVNKQFAKNIRETLQMQTLNRSRSGKKQTSNEEDKRRVDEFPMEEDFLMDQFNGIDLVVKPLPQVERREPALSQTRLLKTSIRATANHVAKYLNLRYQLNDDEDDDVDEDDDEQDDNKDENFPFTLYINAGPGQYNPLPGSIDLAQVNEQHWRQNKPMELFYAYKVNTTS